MRTSAARKASLTLAALALVGVLAACDPPAGSGLALRALSPTTGLQPGDTLEVRLAGADPREVVRYGQCALSDGCDLDRSVRVGDDGAATIVVTVAGTAPFASGGAQLDRACRPDRCSLVAHRADQPGERVALPLALAGARLTAGFGSTAALGDGDRITVTGRAPGAEGAAVRLVQECVEGGCPDRTTLADAPVAADGTFTLAGAVRRSPAGWTRSCAGGSRPCQLAVRVLRTPSAFDTSFGTASQRLRFVAPGPSFTVSPQVEGRPTAVVGQVPGGGDGQVRVRQRACEEPFGGGEPTCATTPGVVVPVAGGRFEASFPAVRTIGGLDCSRGRFPVPDCSVEAIVLRPEGTPDPTVAVGRVPSQVSRTGPSVAVTPSGGLRDGDVATVSGRVDGPAGLELIVRQVACDGSGPCAASAAFAVLTPGVDGLYSTPFTVARTVGGLDCASSAIDCAIRVEVDDGVSAYAPGWAAIDVVG